MREAPNDPGDGNLIRTSAARLRGFRLIFSQLRRFGGGQVRFRKYRIAPRLGMNNVRQRLLRGIHAQAQLTATQTGMA